MDTITLFAKVLLPLPVPKAYTYRVPQEWNDLLQIGQRVGVQFGPRRVYAGIIIDFSDLPPTDYQASYLLEILDEEPIVSPSQLKFWNWMSRYYMCHLGEVMAAALPAGFRLQSESALVLNPEFDEELRIEMDEKEWDILSLIIKKGSLRVDDAAKAIGLKSPMKYIKSLYSRGMILMQEEVKDSYKPKTEAYLSLTDIWDNEITARDALTTLEKRAPKQANVILAMLGSGDKEVLRKSLIEKFDIELSHVKALEKKGYLTIAMRQTNRLQKVGNGNANFELTQEQHAAVQEIDRLFKEGKPVLLHGSTGSGKTFIYQHYIQQVLNRGEQVLYLVPEVGLTEQLVNRLAVYFGKEMGVWHHYYSSNERTELYLKIQEGQCGLLLGARSAVFAPFKKLGLIVVDEEHENTYKQFDKRPHYHGRDTALYLAAIHKCNVILGTATPSYEMLQSAHDGKTGLVKLQKRFIATPPAEITIIHSGEAKQQNRMKQIFSAAMLEGIQEVLDSKGQVIVYQNRKGYVPYISCDFCGFTAHCINCDIALTYYKSLHTQKCSYCSYTQDPVSQCPACGSTSLSMRGFGTERLAEDLAIFFPEARITRFDQESIRNRKDFQRILQGFENGDIDILVGTQLLSKGLDFQNVGIVAVPDADMLLNIPDFRSHERAFQQLHQVAGRAGRGNKSGKVMVQTHQASHSVIKALVENDFYSLATDEIAMRKALEYPPFTRLIRVIIKHKDPNLVKEAAQVFIQAIDPTVREKILGPQTPVVAKIRNYFLQHLLVKIEPDADKIRKIKKYLFDISLRLIKMDNFKGIRVDFDVDPN